MVGIGHTRWATHGAPTRDNAHPHQAGGVAVVHNGIIENFQVLRDELIAKGHRFETETDTEVIPSWSATIWLRASGRWRPPRRRSSGWTGRSRWPSCSPATTTADRGAPGSPLAIGYGDGEMYLGSDALALAPLTNRIQYLEEGDWAVLNPAAPPSMTPRASRWSARSSRPRCPAR